MQHIYTTYVLIPVYVTAAALKPINRKNTNKAQGEISYKVLNVLYGVTGAQ